MPAAHTLIGVELPWSGRLREAADLIQGPRIYLNIVLTACQNDRPSRC
jgi:hypothetical protein